MTAIFRARIGEAEKNLRYGRLLPLAASPVPARLANRDSFSRFANWSWFLIFNDIVHFPARDGCIYKTRTKNFERNNN
jgi:hypothetical protein